jgi:DNA-binding IclR family transcriptional regulator
MTSSQSTTNQSLARGLQILQAVGTNGPEIGVRELARMLDIDKSICSRLMNTLADHGFLEQNPQTRRYRIGARAFQVGQRYTQSNPLYNVAYDELHRLSEEEHLNVYLGIRSDQVLMYLCSIQGAQPSVFRINTGATGHLHTTSAGKVLLAAMPDEALDKLLARMTLARLTPYSITERDRLIENLREIRAKGYAVSDEENLIGVYAVGAPIRDSSGHIRAAISAAFGKDGALEQTRKRVVEIVERTAGVVSAKLGAYPGPAFASVGISSS